MSHRLPGNAPDQPIDRVLNLRLATLRVSSASLPGLFQTLHIPIMASSTMPPPPTPFAHRRTHRLITKSLSPSPPASLESSTCILHKMSLSKGATFHCSPSPAIGDDPVLSIAHLTRRSPTCSPSILNSWLSDKEDVAQSIANFEQTFSGARGKKTSSRRRATQPLDQQVWVRRVSLPSDEGLGSSISPASDKGLAKKFERALDLLSNRDSGLGYFHQ